MVRLSRRALMTGASAAAAITPIMGSAIAKAAAPLAGAQAAGWYRYKLGDFEVTVATDGATTFPLTDAFITNAKKDEVNAALAAAYMEQDKMTIPYSPIVINTGTKLVVMDTGTGEANLERSKGASGQFQGNLKAAGIDRNAIDMVIISHFHGDHINGLITPDGKPAFPNAEVLVPAVEWKYFMDDGEMSRQTTDRMKGVFAGTRKVFDALQRKVTPYEAGKELVPGITTVATPGHTPGHTSYVVASGASKVYVQADVTNNPVLFARNPGWHAFFDQDAQMAEDTRRKVYDMLVAEKMLVQGFHYPFPSLAHVEKTATGYREIPVAWRPVL